MYDLTTIRFFLIEIKQNQKENDWKTQSNRNIKRIKQNKKGRYKYAIRSISWKITPFLDIGSVLIRKKEKRR